MYLNACRTCSTIIFSHSIIYHWFNSFNISLICGVVFAIIFSWTPYCQDENGKDVKCMSSLRNDGRHLSENIFIKDAMRSIKLYCSFSFMKPHLGSRKSFTVKFVIQSWYSSHSFLVCNWIVCEVTWRVPKIFREQLEKTRSSQAT